MRVSDIVDVLAAQGDFKTDRMLFESALYYYGAIVLNIMNVRKPSVNNKRTNINYYGISFAGSGAGKDFALNTVMKAFDIDDREYVSEMKNALSLNTGAFSGADPLTPKEYEDIINGLPLSHNLGLDGTREGIFLAAKSQSISCYGSFNVGSSEFGDIINNSSDLLGTLKELYDGAYKAKVIKSENVSAIKDITVNMMAFGSHAGLDSQARKEFNKLASSGMYRRSFIIDIKPSTIDANDIYVDIEPVNIHLRNLKERVIAGCSGSIISNGHNFWEYDFEITNDAIEEISVIKRHLLDEANKDIYDDIQSAERGAFTMIENLAYIMAFLEDRKIVEQDDVMAAFDFYKRCRDTTKGIFSIQRPFKAMYDMLNKRPGMTVSEMASIDNAIPTSSMKIKDELALLKEHCYINNQLLKEAGTEVRRYYIENLPFNDNTEILISICIDNRWEKSIDYAPMRVPFFGSDISSVETLVNDENIQSFCTAQFEPGGTNAPNGHRKLENFISGQNMLAFDIDEGLELDECIELLKPYTYLIYTTKSHQIEKSGRICDRYRVMMPTKNMFYVSVEQHKQLYDNIAKLIGVTVYDIQTRNVSRLWYTNKAAKIFKNVGENIDVSCCIPSTITEKKFIEQTGQIDESRTDASIVGIMKWFFANTSMGNRNDHLFRVGKFVKDLGEDFEKIIIDVNAMMDSPVGSTELKNIILSVSKK